MFKRTPLNWFASVALSVLLLAASAPGRAQSPSHPQWVGTWATAPMLADGSFHMYPFASVTLREIAHISAGGDQIRIRFTNEFNLSPLTISTAHVAVSAGGAAIKDGSDHALTFGGSASVVVPPGAVMYSDPVALAVAPLSDVAVSFFLPAQVIRGETYHSYADQDNYMADGDQTASATLSNATAIQSWYFFDGIDVSAAEGSRAVIAIGDYITDNAADAQSGSWFAWLDGYSSPETDTLQQTVINDFPVVPLWFGCFWETYNTTNYLGFPTATNYFARGGPQNGADLELALLSIRRSR